MKKEKFQMRAAVYLVLIRDRKILLLRRANTGWRDGFYSLPAGHVDGKETIAAATAREAREEAGVSVKEEDLRVAHVQHRMNPDVEYIDFWLTTDTWQGEPSNCEPDKCDDLSWFPLDALPENTIPYVRDAIAHIEAGTPFSEWHEPETKF